MTSYLATELEDLGRSGGSVSVVIGYRRSRAERRIDYADGTSTPPTGDHIELVDVECHSYYYHHVARGRCTAIRSVERRERLDWFAVIDRIVWARITEPEATERIEELILEHEFAR